MLEVDKSWVFKGLLSCGQVDPVRLPILGTHVPVLKFGLRQVVLLELGLMLVPPLFKPFNLSQRVLTRLQSSIMQLVSHFEFDCLLLENTSEAL